MEKKNKKKMCRPLSHDIPRGENKCLILTIKYDNIVTMLELRKELYHSMNYTRSVIYN